MTRRSIFWACGVGGGTLTIWVTLGDPPTMVVLWLWLTVWVTAMGVSWWAVREALSDLEAVRYGVPPGDRRIGVAAGYVRREVIRLGIAVMATTIGVGVLLRWHAGVTRGLFIGMAVAVLANTLTDRIDRRDNLRAMSKERILLDVLRAEGEEDELA